MNALRNHCAKARKHDENKKDLAGIVFKRMDLLKRHVFNKLRGNNTKQKEEMERQKR
jgi:ribosomal protein S15P/S13E